MSNSQSKQINRFAAILQNHALKASCYREFSTNTKIKILNLLQNWFSSLNFHFYVRGKRLYYDAINNYFRSLVKVKFIFEYIKL